MAFTNISAPNNGWSDWYKSENAYLVGETPFSENLSFGFIPDTNLFNGPYRVQVLYATENGFLMQEQVFTGSGDFSFEIGANTASHVYFRVMSGSTIPTGVRLTDDQEFNEVPENEVPEWTPYDPSYIPTEPEQNSSELPSWVPEVLAPFDNAKTKGSPLIIDLDGDGIELTTFDAAITTFFDIDNDGFAEQTAWIAADQDGLLARDINGDGVINNASELFGSLTVDGFAILAELDSNGDLVIDARDAAWSELIIWKDANGDAISQAGELKTLDDYNITSIDLAGVAASTQVINGNPISHISTVSYTDTTTASIVDAWFVYDHMNTYYAQDYTLDIRTLFLPSLRGFGKLADLHIAMSQNENLLAKMQNFAGGWSLDSFADGAALDTQIADILYHWAGVENVDPASRGPFFDGRHLEFLEEFVGEEWSVVSGIRDYPAEQAAEDLWEAWFNAFHKMKTQLILQVGGDTLFANPVTYNLQTGEIEGTLDLDQQAINDMVSHALAPGVNINSYWLAVADFLEFTKGLSNLTAQEEGWLDTALQSSGLSLDWTGIEDIYLDSSQIPGQAYFGSSGDDVLFGTEGDDYFNTSYGNDELHGLDGDDVFYGKHGDDDLYGDAGNDILWGQNDNDTLRPGTGGNFAYGGYGDDIYVYGGGSDVYRDDGGTDVIEFEQGITAGDLTFSRLGDKDLLVEISGQGSIVIEDHVNYSSGDTRSIETIRFHDLTTINLLALTGLVTYGTEGNDTNIQGIWTLENQDDIIYGLGGNDNIQAREGDDTIDGGTGNDTLNGAGGDDTFIASPGYDNISAGSGFDNILIPEAYSPTDLQFVRLSTDRNDLHITISGLGQIEVINQFGSNGNSIINEITFADGSPAIDLTTTVFETRGTEGNDSLSGLGSGGSINDILNGLGGNDFLTSGSGEDTVYGGDGNDIIYGGNDNDTLYGDAGNDTIRGDYGNDIIHGGDDHDTLKGFNGDDILYGDTGDDMLYGGFGNDTLYGGDGIDLLYGQGGADIFSFDSASAFNNSDNIQDFSIVNGDTIDIADLLVGYDPVMDAITDFVQITDDGTTSYLAVDSDGGADNFIQIASINNVTGLTDEEYLETSGNLITA